MIRGALSCVVHSCFFHPLEITENLNNHRRYAKAKEMFEYTAKELPQDLEKLPVCTFPITKRKIVYSARCHSLDGFDILNEIVQIDTDIAPINTVGGLV